MRNGGERTRMESTQIGIDTCYQENLQPDELLPHGEYTTQTERT